MHLALIKVRERHNYASAYVARHPAKDPAHRIFSCRDPRDWGMPCGRPYVSRLLQVEAYRRVKGMTGQVSAWQRRDGGRRSIVTSWSDVWPRLPDCMLYQIAEVVHPHRSIGMEGSNATYAIIFSNYIVIFRQNRLCVNNENKEGRLFPQFFASCIRLDFLSITNNILWGTWTPQIRQTALQVTKRWCVSVKVYWIE